MSIERAVALLTPLFAALAGALTAWLGKHFPGLPVLNPAEVTALMAGGALTAGAAALKWLHGRAHYTELVAVADKAKADLVNLQAQIAANPVAGPALVDVETLLKAHESQILSAVDQHLPAAVQKSLALLLGTTGQAAPVSAVVPAGAPGTTGAPLAQ